MKLDQVTTGRVLAPRRLMVYGVHGVGKSSYAANADQPIFIQTEDGLGDIDCAKFPLATEYDDVMAALGELYTKQHDYHAVVIDSLDWLERLIFTHVCASREVENIEDIGYAKGYAFALTQWREILDGLDALRSERGMTIILIAHAKVEKFNDPENDAYDRYAPRLHKFASALIQEWSDEVFFATYKVYTKSTDQGFDRTRTQGLGTGERIVRTTERPAHLAKNRLGLPDEMPLDFTFYAACVRGENPFATTETTAQETA